MLAACWRSRRSLLRFVPLSLPEGLPAGLLAVIRVLGLDGLGCPWGTLRLFCPGQFSAMAMMARVHRPRPAR